MDDKDLQSTARQIRHQMIALNNKDFVPACFYGLPGLHDGEQVQLSTFPYNGGASRVHSMEVKLPYCIQ